MIRRRKSGLDLRFFLLYMMMIREIMKKMKEVKKVKHPIGMMYKVCIIYIFLSF